MDLARFDPTGAGVLPAPLAIALLVAAGVVAGALNVVAGGGSFLTLPALIFLGLPPTVANATNRVGILLQNLGAVWSFDRDGVLDRRSLAWAALPATAGSLAGSVLALGVSDAAFQRLLAILMVVLTLWSLWPRRQDAAPRETTLGPLGLGVGFFAVGIYGGFVQAGVGFLMLVLTTAAGLDLVRGNAIKVLTALAFTVVSLVIFAARGLVAWPAGLALGVGNLLGGLLGARLTVRQGDRWVRRVVTAAVLVLAVKLWLDA